MIIPCISIARTRLQGASYQGPAAGVLPPVSILRCPQLSWKSPNIVVLLYNATYGAFLDLARVFLLMAMIKVRFIIVKAGNPIIRVSATGDVNPVRGGKRYDRFITDDGRSPDSSTTMPATNGNSRSWLDLWIQIPMIRI